MYQDRFCSLTPSRVRFTPNRISGYSCFHYTHCVNTNWYSWCSKDIIFDFVHSFHMYSLPHSVGGYWRIMPFKRMQHADVAAGGNGAMLIRLEQHAMSF